MSAEGLAASENPESSEERKFDKDEPISVEVTVDQLKVKRNLCPLEDITITIKHNPSKEMYIINDTTFMDGVWVGETAEEACKQLFNHIAELLAAQRLEYKLQKNFSLTPPEVAVEGLACSEVVEGVLPSAISTVREVTEKLVQ